MGQFSWVNLDLVRDEAGEDWSRLQAKVYAVATHFIEKRLGPRDVVMRVRDGFMIVFGTLEGEAAERRSAQISLELNAFFVGERAFRHISVRAKATTVSAEQMMSMISDAQASKKDEPVPGPEPDAGWERFGERRAERHYHREESVASRPSPSLRFEPDTAGKESELPPSCSVELTDREWNSYHEAETQPDSSRPIGAVWFEPAFKEADAPWSEIVFRPCWDAKAEVIASNKCLARRSHRGRYYYGRDTLMGSADPALRRKLDVSVAYAAQKSFLESYRKRRACALVIPVFYDTVRRAPDRLRYLMTLRLIPEGMRRFFSMRLMETPTDVAPSQLQDVLGAIRAAGFNILVDVPLGQGSFERFEWCNVSAFGSEIPLRCNTRSLPAADYDALSIQVKAARNLGARSYLTNVVSPDLIPGAMSAGVRYFTGISIAEETPHPVPLMPLAFSKIMSRVPAE